MLITFTYHPLNQEDEQFQAWLSNIRSRFNAISEQKKVFTLSFKDCVQLDEKTIQESDLILFIQTNANNLLDWTKETLKKLSASEEKTLVLKKDKVTETEDLLVPFLVAPLYKSNEDILSVLERISEDKGSHIIPSYHFLQLIIDYTYFQGIPNTSGKKVYLSYTGEENFELFMGIVNELSEKGFRVVHFPFGTSLNGQELKQQLESTFKDVDYIVQLTGTNFPSAFKKFAEHYNTIECTAATAVYDTYIEEYSDFTEVPYNRVICLPEAEEQEVDEKQGLFNKMLIDNKKYDSGAHIFKGNSFEIKEFVVKEATMMDMGFKDLANLDDEVEQGFVYLIGGQKNESLINEVAELLTEQGLEVKKQPYNFYNGSNEQHQESILKAAHLCIIGVNETVSWIMSNISILRKKRLSNSQRSGIIVVKDSTIKLQEKHVLEINYEDGYEDSFIDSIFIKTERS